MQSLPYSALRTSLVARQPNIAQESVKEFEIAHGWACGKTPPHESMKPSRMYALRENSTSIRPTSAGCWA